MSETHLYKKGDYVILKRGGDVFYAVIADLFESQIGPGYTLGILKKQVVDCYSSCYQKEVEEVSFDEIVVNTMMES